MIAQKKLCKVKTSALSRAAHTPPLVPLTPAWLYNPYMTRVRPRILRVAAGVEY
jgi:hypothetical protein